MTPVGFCGVGRMRRPAALLALVTTLATVGCGARLDTEQRDRAIHRGAAQLVDGAAAPAATTGPGAASSTQSGTAVAGGNTGSKGTAGTAGTASTQRGSSAGPKNSCSATSANNGGATDRTGISATTIKLGLVADI